jgi:hypothetical protein
VFWDIIFFEFYSNQSNAIQKKCIAIIEVDESKLEEIRSDKSIKVHNIFGAMG